MANSPKVAMFGEGSGPEAYVPLAGGRHIPVQIAGGGGMPAVNFRGGGLHVHGSMDSATLPQVQAMMAKSQQQVSADLQRNIGLIYAKYNQRNG